MMVGLPPILLVPNREIKVLPIIPTLVKMTGIILMANTICPIRILLAMHKVMVALQVMAAHQATAVPKAIAVPQVITVLRVIAMPQDQAHLTSVMPGQDSQTRARA
jgi:hypothetical protein